MRTIHPNRQKDKNLIFPFFSKKNKYKKNKENTSFFKTKICFFKQRADSSQDRFERGVQLSAQDLTFLTPHKQNILNSVFNF